MYLKFLWQSIKFTFKYILSKIQRDKCGTDEKYLKGDADFVRSFLGNPTSQTIS